MKGECEEKWQMEWDSRALQAWNFYYYVESFSLGIDNNRIRGKKNLGSCYFCVTREKWTGQTADVKKKIRKRKDNIQKNLRKNLRGFFLLIVMWCIQSLKLRVLHWLWFCFGFISRWFVLISSFCSSKCDNKLPFDVVFAFVFISAASFLNSFKRLAF